MDEGNHSLPFGSGSMPPMGTRHGTRLGLGIVGCTMRIYIAGPITGMREKAPAKFLAAYEYLRALGYTPINPLDVEPGCLGECTRGQEGYDGTGHTWGCFLKYDLAALLTCDAIYLLRGWEASRGAQLEMSVASNCGIEIYYEEEVNVQRDPEVGRPGYVRSGEAPGV